MLVTDYSYRVREGHLNQTADHMKQPFYRRRLFWVCVGAVAILTLGFGIASHLKLLSQRTSQESIYSDPTEIQNSTEATTAATEPPEVQKVYENPLWKKLYANELRKHRGYFSFRFVSPRFNICDLDGNGTPELLISDNDVHGSGVEIFTVYQGKLIDFGSYGSWGEVQFNSNNKYIFSGFTNNGYNYTDIYKIKNGEMIKLVSFWEDTGVVADKSKWHYNVDDKNVSKAEYDAASAKYGESDSAWPFVRKYTTTESGIAQSFNVNPNP